LHESRKVFLFTRRQVSSPTGRSHDVIDKGEMVEEQPLIVHADSDEARTIIGTRRRQHKDANGQERNILRQSGVRDLPRLAVYVCTWKQTTLLGRTRE